MSEARSEGRLPTRLAVVLALLAGYLLTAIATAPGSSAISGLVAPFAPGQTWYVCQGYNGGPSHSGDPALDMTIESARGPNGCYGNANASANQPVYAPASGSLVQVSADYGGVCITFPSGGSMYLGHLLNRRGNGAVNQGDQIGTIAPAGQVNNGGYAHVHLSARSGSGCGGTHVPFSAANGAQFACAPDMTYSGAANQWAGTTLARCPGGNPFGSFDSVTSPGPGQIRVGGWAIDPDAKTTSIDIHVYVGGPAGSGTGFNTGPASASRPDVGAAYPGSGDNHGFDTVVTSRGGTVPVYVYAINVGSGGNVLIGQKSVVVANPDPFGHFDGVTSPQGGELSIHGWTVDPNDHAAALNFHVYVGGPAGDPNAEGLAFGPADAARPDVDDAFPGVGDHHGIDYSFATTKSGVQAVYLYAINVGPGDNVLLGSYTVDVGTGPPHITATHRTKVRGSARVGKRVRAAGTRWSVTDVTLNYQWFRDGHPIRKATRKRYDITAKDRGHRVRVVVTATKVGYVAGQAASRAVRP